MKDKIRLLAGTDLPVCTTRPVFDDLVLDFLDALSVNIRNYIRRKPSEDIASFGFWCRRQHLEALKKRHDDGRIHMGCGMAFHLPPANVPAMFAYSLAISMLAGNSNIVRVSERTGETGQILCSLISHTLEDHDFRELKKAISLITYERDDTLTRQMLTEADVRIVWGSDETVRQMMTVPAKPGAASLCFSDHWSMALISQRALAEMDEDEMSLFVRHFYNDTYIMDQRGCSSPQLVVFLVDGAAEGREKFWQRLGDLADEIYPLDAFKAARRYELLAGFLLQHGDGRNMQISNSPGSRLQILHMRSLPEEIHEYKGGFGLFYETKVSCFEDLGPVLGGRLQTIVCEGIDLSGLKTFMVNGRYPAACRVVSPGEALMMDTVWDGKDLIAGMSRIVDFHDTADNGRFK